LEDDWLYRVESSFRAVFDTSTPTEHPPAIVRGDVDLFLSQDIGVVTTDGVFLVKQGIGGIWTTETTGMKSAMIS
jgi:hypothetical protein